MKRIFKASLILLCCLVFMPCCKRSPKAAEEQAKNQPPTDYSALREEILEVIQHSPKAKEIMEFLEAHGASYIHDITLPAGQAEHFETAPERSLALGVYAADMWYAFILQRYDVVVQNAEIMEQLMVRNGFMENFPDHSRIIHHENNADSLEMLIDKNLRQYYEVLRQQDSPELEAMIFVGVNMEALYLLSQLTRYARDNQQMAHYLMTKADHARAVMRLLEILAREPSVRPYYERMLPVIHYFDNHPEMNQEQIMELADLIESMRNQILL